MRHLNWQRHQFRRFAAGKSKHHSLITGALRLFLFALGILGVHAARNVRALLSQRNAHAATASIKSLVGVVVAGL